MSGRRREPGQGLSCERAPRVGGDGKNPTAAGTSAGGIGIS